MLSASPSSVFHTKLTIQNWEANKYSILTVTEPGPPVSESSTKILKSKAPTDSEHKLNLDIPKWNQKTFEYKSLNVLGPKILSNLPYQVKSSENLDTFKNLLKNLDGNLCKCNICKRWYLLKSCIPQYYLFSLIYFYIGSSLLIIIYIIFFLRISCKNVTKFFFVNSSLFLKFQFT